MDNFVFEECQKINDFISNHNEVEARDALIKLLEHHKKNSISYTPLVNHLIRETGLYPYIQTDNAAWEDRFVHEAFKVNNGEENVTLHREQSLLLKAILDGESIAVSAPTSFGKSFILDAFIALKSPQNVIIIVPTIALMDETRRRLYKKFSDRYKIITTTDTALADKNILIFPQERALAYLEDLKSLDLLVVDEFYKASEELDKERSSSLVRALIGLGKIAKQKYFLAPNVKNLKENPFTKGLRFIQLLNFNTVYLQKHELYKELVKGDESQKSDTLIKILHETDGKTLIYAGTHSNVDTVSNLLNTKLEIENNKLLSSFSKWLAENYSANWSLTSLVQRKTGIHTGRLHRSLGQIQIKLFEEPNGLVNIISTSSIIEGVNTSAQNVVLWRNKIDRSNLTDFTYRNIIGRGGRMFQHFVGQIYLLEEPPAEKVTELNISLPKNLLAEIDENNFADATSKERIKNIIATKSELKNLLGASFDKLLRDNVFQTSDALLIKTIAEDMLQNRTEWNGLANLNSSNPEHWDRLLYKIIKLSKGKWGRYKKFVEFVKALTKNWEITIPELLKELEALEIDLNSFFELEKKVTFNLSALISDVNQLQKILLNTGTDISPFVSKTAHAFLPTPVFQLEEYGLPRMISKKIHQAKLIDFEDKELDIHSAIRKLLTIGHEKICQLDTMSYFDNYIVSHFFDGISQVKRSVAEN